jgi:hypothetical protein
MAAVEPTNQSSPGTSGPSGTANSAAPGGASPQTQAQPSASAATSARSPATLPRPDWCPEACFDPQKGFDGEKFGKHWQENVAPVITRDAAEQVRRNALPQKAEDVKLELPKDFALPQGVEFRFDATRPEFAKLQQMAVRRGLDQDTVTELLGVYAESQVGEATLVSRAAAAELEKLGSNAQARVGAIDTFLTGILGAADAKALRLNMVTAAQVKAMENLISRFATQGAPNFNQANRMPLENAAGLVSQDTYDKMSAAERLDYARSPAAQAAMAARRSSRAA